MDRNDRTSEVRTDFVRIGFITIRVLWNCLRVESSAGKPGKSAKVSEMSNLRRRDLAHHNKTMPGALSKEEKAFEIQNLQVKGVGKYLRLLQRWTGLVDAFRWLAD